MERTPSSMVRFLFGSDPQSAARDRLMPRWIFLRALAAIYLSAFYSLLFQIKGLIGPEGVLPAAQYLAAVAHSFPGTRFWFAPTLLWSSSSDRMLMALCWAGMVAAVAALLNLWPRVSFLLAWLCFLSFIAAASDFSGYQSDGMLLEAGFLALFFAPRGFRPGWGELSPPSRASLFLLQWEWFRIYFESGMVKLLSGDQQWRHLTAMDQYYQNGPLPTWVGWYVQQLPHWFHAASAVATLGMELIVVLLLFFPRRLRLLCFLIVTPWEVGVILTANYTFLNYLVLVLGFLLLDDGFLRRVLPARFHLPLQAQDIDDEMDKPQPSPLASLKLAFAAVMLTWITYVTTAGLVMIPFPQVGLPDAPVRALAPFRIANRYGLFAVMTNGRYEIEFHGSNDGRTWTAYPFRYKPQALNARPRIYAPYQPRFDWNLWFASLGDWRQNNIVPLTEERLLTNTPPVLGLFAANPFPTAPPKYVRAVLWQYWFTSIQQKRATGNWWTRKYLGVYAPVLTLQPNGQPAVVAWPDELPEHN